MQIEPTMGIGNVSQCDRATFLRSELNGFLKFVVISRNINANSCRQSCGSKDFRGCYYMNV